MLAGIIETNLSKMCLISYNSYAENKMQQYRMAKGRVAPPKCLFNAAMAVEVKNSIYSNKTIMQHIWSC